MNRNQQFDVEQATGIPLPAPREGDSYLLTLVKGDERYLFLYDSAHRKDVLQTLGRFASHQELAFTWYDAAILSQKVRQHAANELPEIDDCQGI